MMDFPIDPEKALAIHEAWLEALTPKAHQRFEQEVGTIITHVNGAIAQYYALHPFLTHHHLLQAHIAMIGLLEQCLLAETKTSSPHEEHDVP